VKGIKVEEYTSPSVVTITSNADLDMAMELMQEHGIRHLPTTDALNALVEIICPFPEATL
jgi:CBS domain-containing protein